MHTSESLEFNEIQGVGHIPLLKTDVVECPHCRYRIPVPPEYTDWREVAGRYQKCYEAMMQRLDVLLREAGEQFDVPLVEYFDTERQLMISMLKEILETYKK